MHRYTALIFFLCGSLLAQNVVHQQDNPTTVTLREFTPHPYVFVGPEAMGNGYAPLAFEGGAGIRIDSRHFIFDAYGTYDNGHKTDDGTGSNPKGHDRGLDGSMYYRFSSGWAFGGGYAWSQLSTANYTKSGSRPKVGGNRDFFVRGCEEDGCRHEFTMRIGMDYLLAGTDWQNGSKGTLISFFEPSPDAKRHFFYRELLGIYRYHDTVTDRTDALLTGEESSNHCFDSFVEFTIMYRF